MFVKKLPLEYQKVTKTYCPTYLWDSSDSSDISDISDSHDSYDSRDSSDSSDSNDSSDSSDSNDRIIFFDWSLVMELLRQKFCD